MTENWSCLGQPSHVVHGEALIIFIVYYNTKDLTDTKGRLILCSITRHRIILAIWLALSFYFY